MLFFNFFNLRYLRNLRRSSTAEFGPILSRRRNRGLETAREAGKAGRRTNAVRFTFAARKNSIPFAEDVAEKFRLFGWI